MCLLPGLGNNKQEGMLEEEALSRGSGPLLRTHARGLTFLSRG